VCNTFPERLLGKTVEKETWEVKQKPGWHQADQDDEANQTENRMITKMSFLHSLSQRGSSDESFLHLGPSGLCSRLRS